MLLAWKSGTETQSWSYNDGGRKEAGYKGETGDCVVRSIAIALQLPYQEVYDELMARSAAYGRTRRSHAAKQILIKGASPRNGVYGEVYKPYLKEKGWLWQPTMFVGQGCKVHLRSDELPRGRLILRLSRHVTTVIDGVIHDIYDPSRLGTRCVYGYFQKE